jgi:hypothetical protein
MTDPTFETRLRARIRDALDSQAGPHPAWADSPAARRTSDRRRRGRWPIRVLGVAALLAVCGGVLSQVGSRQPRVAEPSPSPEATAPAIALAPVIPDILRGQFVAQFVGAPTAANPYPFYFIDLEDAVLVHGPSFSGDPVENRAEDGTAAQWAGRIVRFTPAGAGTATVVIQAPPPCAEGRYLVRYDEAPRRAQPWTLSFTQPQDPCADRLEILVGGSASPIDLPSPDRPSPTVAPSSSPGAGRVWTHQPTRLVSGERYASWSFTEPFHFIGPREDFPASAWTWLAPGHLAFSHPYWFGDLLDDWTLPIDHCDPTAGSLPDIPSSPDALESWLRSNGRSIDRSADLEVDGRTATRYDTSVASEPPRDCAGPPPDAVDYSTVRFLSRWYLIPTGDDTILFNVYGDTEAEYQVADEIVRSMTFDDR